MAFFTYNQNNSGGGFAVDEAAGIAEFVIIEAATANQANGRAVDIGLYFDGVAGGEDCDCCGDRWSGAWSDERGTEVPEVYDKPVLSRDYVNRYRWTSPEGFIHYLDGRVVEFGRAEAKAA